MIYGWAIWNLGGADQAEKCRLAAAMGLDFVSFNASPLAWAKRNPGGGAATPGLLAELGLAWTVHCAIGRADRPESPSSLSESLDEIAAFAADAGPPVVVSTDPGYNVDDSAGWVYDREATARGLEAIFERLSLLGMRIALENWRTNSRPEQLDEMGRRFDGLGMLLDIGHMNIHVTTTGLAVGDYVASLPLPVIDLHMHDNDGTADQHLPLGEGTLALAETAGALGALGYDGPATIEVCPGLKSLDAAKPGDLEKVRSTLAAARRAFGT